MDLGVYVHFPWCRRRCPYCDFAIAVAPLEEIPHAGYADAVLGELFARAPLYAGRRLASIYFGGGTPALWRAREVRRVIDAVRAAFGDPAPDALEITVEANPNDATPATLGALREAGVNRLSIGAQSFADAELVQLGRDHGAMGSLAALPAARAAGFAEVSLDLIYALPGRSLDDWRRTLERAVEAAPEHLSVYQLTIEPRTTFGEAERRGALRPASDDACAEQFQAAHERLEAAGYEHYEVSSYARPGHRARHNGLYWRGADYLGLGNGAHSFLRLPGGGGLRWANHRSVVRYLAARPPADPRAELDDDPRVAEVTRQGPADVAADAVWLGLRTIDGVLAARLAGREREVERLRAAGLLEVQGERVRPTSRGLLFADEVGARLLQ